MDEEISPFAYSGIGEIEANSVRRFFENVEFGRDADLAGKRGRRPRCFRGTTVSVEELKRSGRNLRGDVQFA
jgi:hypothetical protein